MRIKNILSTAAFIFAFVFSAAFAGLFADETAVVAVVGEPDETVISQTDERTQREMLRFLEQDRQNGFQREKELASTVNRNEASRKEAATLKLARKMRRMDDSMMPSDFRAAWENHVQAWEDYADFLHRANHGSSDDELVDESYAQLNSEISRTYYVLLGVARQHGVDFSE